MIVLDTNIVSELLRPSPSSNVESWLASQVASSVYFTAVGEAELRYGLAVLAPGKRRTHLARVIEDILAEDFRDRILVFGREAASFYALIAAQRRGEGRPISSFDCQIAAIARAHNAALATRNEKDFQGCGVELINPWLSAKTKTSFN
jgi:predicted nucleic acid-binding protein